MRWSGGHETRSEKLFKTFLQKIVQVLKKKKKNKRGRQLKKWVDNITESTNRTFANI